MKNSIASLAKVTGVSEQQVYRWIYSGVIPAPSVVVGKRKYYSPKLFGELTKQVKTLWASITGGE